MANEKPKGVRLSGSARQPAGKLLMAPARVTVLLVASRINGVWKRAQVERVA